MSASSPRDLITIILLSIIVLGLVWLTPLLQYQLFLIFYILSTLLAIYFLIGLIKPKKTPLFYAIIGILLSTIVILALPLIEYYLKTEFSSQYLLSLCLVLIIVVSYLTFRRARTLSQKEKFRQITIEEAMERSKSKPVTHPSLKETPIKEKYLEFQKSTPQNKENGFESSMEVPEYYKKEKYEIYKPIWADNSTPEGGFKYWDLIFVLFLAMLSLLTLYNDSFKLSIYSSLLSLLTILILVGYLLISFIYPHNKDLNLLNRLLASFSVGLFLNMVLFVGWKLNLLTTTSLSIYQILFILTLSLILVNILRRRYQTSSDGEETTTSGNIENLPEEIVSEKVQEQHQPPILNSESPFIENRSVESGINIYTLVFLLFFSLILAVVAYIPLPYVWYQVPLTIFLVLDLLMWGLLATVYKDLSLRIMFVLSLVVASSLAGMYSYLYLKNFISEPPAYIIYIILAFNILLLLMAIFNRRKTFGSNSPEKHQEEMH